MKQILIALLIAFLSFVNVGYGCEVSFTQTDVLYVPCGTIEEKGDKLWQNLSTGNNWVFTQAHINQQRLVNLQEQIDKLKEEIVELKKMAEGSSAGRKSHWMDPFSKVDVFGNPTVFSDDFMKD